MKIIELKEENNYKNIIDKNKISNEKISLNDNNNSDSILFYRPSQYKVNNI